MFMDMKAFLLQSNECNQETNEMKPQLLCQSVAELVSSCPAQQLETTCSKVISIRTRQQIQ